MAGVNACVGLAWHLIDAGGKREQAFERQSFEAELSANLSFAPVDKDNDQA